LSSPVPPSEQDGARSRFPLKWDSLYMFPRIGSRGSKLAQRSPMRHGHERVAKRGSTPTPPKRVREPSSHRFEVQRNRVFRPPVCGHWGVPRYEESRTRQPKLSHHKALPHLEGAPTTAPIKWGTNHKAHTDAGQEETPTLEIPNVPARTPKKSTRFHPVPQ